MQKHFCSDAEIVMESGFRPTRNDFCSAQVKLCEIRPRMNVSGGELLLLLFASGRFVVGGGKEKLPPFFKRRKNFFPRPCLPP